MSLSQRYSGKILTPWFDLEEWISTRQLIYSDSVESQQIALERLKVWKIRTPLLSVGIEGTLIILEALMEKHRTLSDYEKAQIFSTALLRFLNICAASSERQGTFYKTAQKNDLPYWLITLRHDIAHDHKIPSQTLLECALMECFGWIKNKYWEVQSAHMQDLVVSDETNFIELMYNYANLNLLILYEEKVDEFISAIKNKFESIIPELVSEVCPKSVLSLLENFLVENVANNEIKDSSLHIVTTLVKDEILFNVNCYFSNGVKKIPSTFVHKWFRIINLLYQNGSIFLLIERLADVTESCAHESYAKEVASLWISEIYQGFLKTRFIEEKLSSVKSAHSENVDVKILQYLMESMWEDNPNLRDSITFDKGTLPLESSLRFQERTFSRPSEYSLNYLETVCKYNGHDNDFIKKKYKDIKNLVQLEKPFYTDPDIMYTLKDLQDFERNIIEKNISVNDFSDGMGKKKKFVKLTDAEKFRFKGYPLGI